MNNVHTSAICLFLFAALPLLGQQAPERKTGFTFLFGTPDSGISVRRILTPKWTALGIVSYNHTRTSDEGTISPGNFTGWSLGAGIRRVFTSEELHPFLDADAAVSHANGGCTANYPSGFLSGGVEYFVARRVSIEGSAGLRYNRFKQNCGGDTPFQSEQHSVGTFRSALGLTFYF